MVNNESLKESGLVQFIPTEPKNAFMLTCLMQDAVNRNGFNKDDPMYQDYDFDTVNKVIEQAIWNNIALDNDFTNMKDGKAYLLLFYDKTYYELRGMLLFSLETGMWFSKNPSRSVVEHFQLRFDNTRLSAGVSRYSVEFLKELVLKGIVDRALGGGSTAYQEQVKNSYLKAGYKLSYEFCYEKGQDNR